MNRMIAAMVVIVLALTMVTIVVGVVRAQTIPRGLNPSWVNGVAGSAMANSTDRQVLLAAASTVTRPVVETQVTSNGNTQWRPEVYGDYVVWQDQRNGNADIYMASLWTLTETAVTTNAFNQEHPDIYDDYIVWYDWRNGNADVYLYDLQTLSETQITTNTSNQRLPKIWGDTIVWNDWRNGNWDVYGYSISGQTEFTICTNAAHQYFPEIGGRYAVWWDERNGIGNWDIYAFDLQTLTEIEVITDTNNQGYPVVSGNYFAWIDNRNGNWDIYGYDLSTSTEFPICVNTSDQFRPAIHGHIVTWFDLRHGNQDIYGYDLKSGEEFRITTNTSDQRHPAVYCPSSVCYVAWHDRRDGNYDIFVARVGWVSYLPLIARNYVSAPDLVVERIVATANDVQVVIANRGNAAATDEFWVDVYIDPSPVPTAVNQIWPYLAAEGLTWGVTVAMQPGDVITLTVGDAYYVPAWSDVSWPLAPGTPVYAQVDSWNSATTWGAVRESHEITGGAYNNIGSTTVSVAAGATAPLAPTGGRPTGYGDLPPRR